MSLGVVAGQHAQLRVFLHHNQQASARHQRSSAGEDVDNLQRFFHRHAFRHVDKHAVLRQQRVEGSGAVGEPCGLSVVAVNDVGIVGGGVAQRFYDDTVGQRVCRVFGGLERVVYKKIQARA